MSEENHHKILWILSSWRFWIGVAYFALAAVVVVVYSQNNRENTAEQLRVSAVRSTAQSEYENCVTSIPLLTSVNEFVAGVEGMTNVLIANMLATHAITPPGTALYATQTANLLRFHEAAAGVRAVRLPIPTVAECAAERSNYVRIQHG